MIFACVCQIMPSIYSILNAKFGWQWLVTSAKSPVPHIECSNSLSVLEYANLLPLSSRTLIKAFLLTGACVCISS
jgi:hypothetical protein